MHGMYGIEVESCISSYCMHHMMQTRPSRRKPWETSVSDRSAQRRVAKWKLFLTSALQHTQQQRKHCRTAAALWLFVVLRENHFPCPHWSDCHGAKAIQVRITKSQVFCCCWFGRFASQHSWLCWFVLCVLDFTSSRLSKPLSIISASNLAFKLQVIILFFVTSFKVTAMRWFLQVPCVHFCPSTQSKMANGLKQIEDKIWHLNPQSGVLQARFDSLQYHLLCNRFYPQIYRKRLSLSQNLPLNLK